MDTPSSSSAPDNDLILQIISLPGVQNVEFDEEGKLKATFFEKDTPISVRARSSAAIRDLMKGRIAQSDKDAMSLDDLSSMFDEAHVREATEDEQNGAVQPVISTGGDDLMDEVETTEHRPSIGDGDEVSLNQQSQVYDLVQPKKNAS